MYRSITLHYSRPLSRGSKHAWATKQRKALWENIQSALVFCVVILYHDLDTKLTSSYNSANLFKHTTVYILHLFHCESACAHFILLFHNLYFFYVYTVV